MAVSRSSAEQGFSSTTTWAGAFAWLTVAAPREWRVEALVYRDGITAAEAEKRITKSDKDCDAFHHHYFKVEANSTHLYDMGFNAARISTDTAARMIAIAAGEMGPRPG